MKKTLKKLLVCFVKAILAGVFISIGGTVFLLTESKVLGALFFTIGLFVIVHYEFNLYTGKVGYVFSQDKTYALNLIPIWLGNLFGTLLTALLLHFTRYGEALTAAATRLTNIKLQDSWYGILILAVFCNILVFFAVDGFRRIPYKLGKYLALFLGVMVFILCGFEHSVADMFYFFMAKSFTGKTFLYLLLITLGNSIGAVLLPLCEMLWKKKNN